MLRDSQADRWQRRVQGMHMRSRQDRYMPPQAAKHTCAASQALCPLILPSQPLFTKATALRTHLWDTPCMCDCWSSLEAGHASSATACLFTLECIMYQELLEA